MPHQHDIRRELPRCALVPPLHGLPERVALPPVRAGRGARQRIGKNSAHCGQPVGAPRQAGAGVGGKALQGDKDLLPARILAGTQPRRACEQRFEARRGTARDRLRQGEAGMPGARAHGGNQGQTFGSYDSNSESGNLGKRSLIYFSISYA